MALLDTLKNITTKLMAVGTPNEDEVLYHTITKRVEVAEAKIEEVPEKIEEIQVEEKVEEIEEKVQAKVEPKIKKVEEVKSKPLTKKDQKIALYKADILEHFNEVDEAFLAIIVKNLGPSIYRANAEVVSCDNEKELKTVKNNFLIKKLGLSKGDERLDTMIAEVCAELQSKETKYRATVYYRLAIKFDKKEALS